MPGPPPKDPSKRQRRNKSRALLLRGKVFAPPPPAGLLKTTAEQWVAFWKSDIAMAAHEFHLPAVTRLFQWYDERERAYAAMRRSKSRVAKGSKGQAVLHPLLKYLEKCDAQILPLEDRLGLSPKAMIALGGSFAKAQRDLDDLNASLEDDDNDIPDEDPRALSIA